MQYFWLRNSELVSGGVVTFSFCVLSMNMFPMTECPGKASLSYACHPKFFRHGCRSLVLGTWPEAGLYTQKQVRQAAVSGAGKS